MSFILDDFNLNINDFITQEDIQFNNEYDAWEQECISEYENYKIHKPNFDLFKSFRPQWKHKLNFVNETLKSFSHLPKKIRRYVIKAVERETGLKFSDPPKLKMGYYIPDKSGFWYEREMIAHNFSSYRTLVISFSLFKIVNALNEIDPISLSQFDFSDEQINRLAELKVTIYRSKKDPHPRQLCKKYWRRKIRRDINQTTEWVSNILKLAHDKHPFVSRHTLQRHQQMWKRNKEFLETHFLRNDQGDIINLGELVESKINSRNSMMYAITLGMSSKAEKLGYTPCFYTYTLPSNFHPKSDKYEPTISALNQRQELQQRWHRALAMASKSKVRMYGLHATEGHKDGTPHRHALIYVHPSDLEKLNYCFKTHFPESLENSWRKIKDGVSVKLKILNDYRGAVFYVNKYIQKTISFDEDYDFGITDSKDEDHLANYANHKAWASSRNIRRYGFIGIGSIVGKWELIYKQNERPDGFLGKIWDRMQDGKWCEVLEMLGAFEGHSQFSFTNEYKEKLNSYGELCKRLDMLNCTDNETGEIFELPYRPIEWQIVNSVTIRHEQNYESYMASKGSEVAFIESNPRDAQRARSGNSV